MTRARNTTRWLSIAAGLIALLMTTAALSQALSTRRIGVNWREGVPLLSFSARDLANADMRRGLESGLSKRIVLTVQAFIPGRSHPILSAPRTCTVTYDLWDESYVVRIGHRSERHETMDAVLSRCLTLRMVRLGRAEQWAPYSGQSVYFAVRAEFNPISRSRCRALLRSSSSDGPVGPVVVNIVRREICTAERALDFRSPTVTVP